MNVIGEPIDEKGPVVTKMELPIHRDAPAFDEQGSGAELLITGMYNKIAIKDRVPLEQLIYFFIY